MINLHALIEGATAIGAVVTAGSAVYGTARFLPWLKSQNDLIRENANLRVERDEARDAARAFRQSSDGWQAAVEQLGAELRDVKEQISELSTNLGASIMYIVECNEADRHGKPLPPPPEILRPLIQKAYDLYHPQRSTPLEFR